MSILSVTTGVPEYVKQAYDLGVKMASDLTPAYDLAGMLYAKHSERHGGAWLMLSVPNAMVRGVFDALDARGVELPPSGEGRGLEAHISVMRPEEIDKIGGIDKITERGKRFNYRIGGLVKCKPEGWSEMSDCWMLKVHSPELQELRRSYGLSSLPKNGEFEFHITVAVRRKGVLGRTTKAKNSES